jgi:hypothetical protein
VASPPCAVQHAGWANADKDANWHNSQTTAQVRRCARR